MIHASVFNVGRNHRRREREPVALWRLDISVPIVFHYPLDREQLACCDNIGTYQLNRGQFRLSNFYCELAGCGIAVWDHIGDLCRGGIVHHAQRGNSDGRDEGRWRGNARGIPG